MSPTAAELHNVRDEDFDTMSIRRNTEMPEKPLSRLSQRDGARRLGKIATCPSPNVVRVYPKDAGQHGGRGIPGANRWQGSRSLSCMRAYPPRRPASLMSLPIVAISLLMRSANSSGDEPTVSIPTFASRSRVSGRASMPTISWFRR